MPRRLGEVARDAAALVAAASAVMLVAAPVATAERQAVGPSAQRIAISVADVADPKAPIRSGADLKVSIALTEAATGRPSVGLKPRAWVRRVSSAGAVSCSNAAWMGRATGAISLDDVALEGSYLVAVGDDDGGATEDRLRVIDPLKQIASANQISVAPLGGRIAALLVHPKTPRAFVTRPDKGDVAAVDLPWSRSAEPFAGDFVRPSALAPLGDGLAVLDGGDAPRLTRLGADGSRGETVMLGRGPATVSPASDDAALAVSSDGSAALMHVDGGTRKMPAGAFVRPVAAGGGAILSRGPGRAVLLRWLDALDAPTTVPLPFEPTGLHVRADGRYALAWSDDPARAAVVDIASGTASGAVVLPDAVDEVANARRAFVVTHRTAAIASVIDASPMEAGGEPADRRIRLPVQPAPPSGDGASVGRLSGSDARGAAVTVRPGSSVALTISAGGGLSDQAVGALTIRGERPRLIAAFDQRLREESDGRFLGSARLRQGGRYEVVVTTGPGGATGCAGFEVEGPGANEAPAPALRLVSEPPRAAARTRVRLALDNRPAWVRPGRVVLRFDDRAFGGFERVEATLGEDAVLEAEITFPDPGDYVARIEDAGPAIEPLLLRVAP